MILLSYKNITTATFVHLDRLVGALHSDFPFLLSQPAASVTVYTSTRRQGCRHEPNLVDGSSLWAVVLLDQCAQDLPFLVSIPDAPCVQLTSVKQKDFRSGFVNENALTITHLALQ
jgi:hypothetical protein